MGADPVGRLTGKPPPTADEVLERFREAVGELGELAEFLRRERPGLAAGRLLELAVSQYLVPIGQALHDGTRRRCMTPDEWRIPCKLPLGHAGTCEHAFVPYAGRREL